MTRAAVALGSNLESPEEQVRRGFDDIAALPGTELLARSRLYRTAPVGYVDQPDFVNACALVETTLGPRALLDGLLALDLDIVLYGDRVIDEPGLKVPHPRAHERMFVLAPLVDVWPDAVIPGRGRVADIVTPAQAGAQSRRTEP
jgi:2-amino-4-hydroxy-6-hydroxymethyldihydropteridine diphosphokinase